MPLQHLGIVRGAKIGQGAFGSVYRCNHDGVSRALKVISPQENQLSLVLSEILILKQLKHSRIVEMTANFAFSGSHYLVLELMSGSLRDLIKERQVCKHSFTERKLKSHFVDIAAGVKFIHGKNIMHRDLKPENILVTQDDRLKIADFGIAKMTPGQLTMYAKTLIGTAIYMAPEVLQGKNYNKSADIWSLGVVFYEMAMLHHPFENFTLEELCCDAANQIQQVTCYSKQVSAIINRMIRKNPKERSSIERVFGRKTEMKTEFLRAAEA